MNDRKVQDHDFKVMMRELAPASAGAVFTGIELQLPEELSLEDWSAIGRKLCRTDQVVKWWLGDWAAFGAGDKERKQKDWRKYGKLKEFAEANGIDYGTLRNLAWVSRSITLSRRRDNVQWSKHAEVAPLPGEQQERWLEKVEADDLSCAELRRQIRQAGGENNALESDGPIIKFASKACDDLVNWIRTRPEGFWHEERRAAWRQRLSPIVEFWQTL